MPLDDRIADAAVIGAGPAGCSAAITLARRGLHVALLEAGQVGREKLCGEFLSPECRGLLAQLGLADRISSLHPIDIRAARLTAPAGAACEITLPEPGWGLSRSALDAALWEGAQKAGAHVFEKTKVQNVIGDLGRGFVLETAAGTLQARVVIAAHGRRATLDRILGRAFLHQPQPFVALKAHFVGPPLGRRVELHFFPGGYCGLAEIEGGRVNVCLLVREPVFRSAVRTGRDLVDAFFNWMKGQNPHLQERLAAARRVDHIWLSAAQLPFAAKSTLEGDILMAGDAARLVVPLAGDGIAMALQSGMMAGERCASFLGGERGPRELTRGYSASWERAFGERVRLAQSLQWIVLNPRLVGPALAALNRVPFLTRYLVTHTRTKGDMNRPKS